MPVITWKNVDAPTATGASRILDAAGRSLDKGLGQLSGLASQYTQMQNRNLANQGRIATENILGQISGLGSMGDLQAARQSQQFDPSNLPAGVDQKAIRLAMQNQGSVIDDRLSKRAAFESRALGREESDTRVAAENALAAGNLELAAELGAGLRSRAGISSGIRKQQAAIDAKEQARIDKLKGYEREDAAAKQRFEDEQTNIRLQKRLSEITPVEPLKTPEAESADIEKIYGEIGAIAPTENWLGDWGWGAGGADALNMVREGMGELETKIGRKITSSELSQIRDYAKSTKTGADNTWGWDANIHPNMINEFAEKLVGKDTAASSRLRIEATKLEASAAKQRARMEKLRAGR